jgi:hypothetical protein
MAGIDKEPKATVVRRDPDKFCPVNHDRPIYVCPRCNADAMQFYNKCEWLPDREDIYLCCACGATWEL